MKRLLAALLCLAAVPAAAQDAPPVPANDAEAHRLYDQAAALARSGDRAGARAMMDRVLELLPEPSPQRGSVQCVRGMDRLDSDIEAARAAIEECRRLAPQNPIADIAYSRLMFTTHQTGPAVEAMLRAIRAHPEMLAGCDTSDTGEIATTLRLLAYERQDALRGQLIEALVRSPCGQDDAGFFSGMARETIVERVGRGDKAGAVGLLPAVVDPDDLLTLLVDRRLDPIRAELEAQAGPTLVPQREALLQSARSAAARNSGFTARRNLATVLARTGHRAEGIAALAVLLDDRGVTDPDYFLRGTSVARLASLTSENGETDVTRVTAPMRRLLAEANPRDKPGLWNVVPNLALWLLNYGRAKEALDLLDRYPATPADFDSPSAHAYFRALRGCAQFRLGDPRAQATLDSVRTVDAGNLGARRLAALCGPDGAAQRDELLAIAADPADSGSTLIDLVRLRTLGAIGKGPQSFEHAAMLRALADPGLAARVDALTRPLAPSYRGALANWN